MAVAASPERTCVGCRSRRSQTELIRLSAEGGRVVPAQPGAAGRGAYLCPSISCFDAAQKRRAFTRAFRGPVTLDPAVREAVARHVTVQENPAAARCNAPAAAADERR